MLLPAYVQAVYEQSMLPLAFEQPVHDRAVIGFTPCQAEITLVRCSLCQLYRRVSACKGLMVLTWKFDSEASMMKSVQTGLLQGMTCFWSILPLMCRSTTEHDMQPSRMLAQLTL